MRRRNTIVFILLLIIFTISLAAVFPINKGILGKRGIKLGLDLQGGVHLVYQADLSQVAPADQPGAIDGALAILGNRINPMGVTEPLIQKQGGDRILIELPGTKITDQQKEGLSRVDILQFGELAQEGEEAKWENELGNWKPATAEIDGEIKALSSRYFKSNTFVTQGSLSEIYLVFEWDEEGSRISEAVTGGLLGQPLGIFEGNEPLRAVDGHPIAPTVMSTIIDKGQIEGLSFDDASRLSKQLNYGRLPVPLVLIYDETVSPMLGSDFVSKSVKAGIIGAALIMLFMILYYRLPGVVASLALMFYGALVLAIFKGIPVLLPDGVTLTLAGIGGFVVSIGMAVDANMLIFERMKEELATGRTLGAAVEAGFTRAWTAIWDSNVTTFIVCIILYILGSRIAASAPVMSFALTLFIGVAVSMFTAMFVSRTLLRLLVDTAISQRTSLFTIHTGRK
ncbi:MAG: protein translocase subunit SecD [Chloroflexota bacterium]